MAEYELAIKLDDKQLNDQIQRLQKEFSKIKIEIKSEAENRAVQKRDMVKSESTKTSRWDQITQMLGKVNKMQLGITGMSFALGSIVGLLTNMSDILKSMFELLQTGIMLMLKPIADFIGLMLRPVVSLLLTHMILPFYKAVYPWFIKASQEKQESLDKAVKDGDAGIVAGEIATSFTPLLLSELIYQALTDAFDIPSTTLARDIAQHLKWLDYELLKLQLAWGQFWADVEVHWNAFVEWLGNGLAWIWAEIVKAWVGFTGWVEGGLAEIWAKVVAAWTQFTSWIDGGLTWIWGELDKIIEAIKGFDLLAEIKEAFESIKSAFLSVVDFFRDLFGIPDELKSPDSYGKTGKVMPYADGGIITEPIIGRGLNSGSMYSLGEKGPETITPVGSTSYGSTININATVRGKSDIDMIVREVKRALHEDSRRAQRI